MFYLWLQSGLSFISLRYIVIVIYFSLDVDFALIFVSYSRWFVKRVKYGIFLNKPKTPPICYCTGCISRGTDLLNNKGHSRLLPGRGRLLSLKHRILQGMSSSVCNLLNFSYCLSFSLTGKKSIQEGKKNKIKRCSRAFLFTVLKAFWCTELVYWNKYTTGQQR